MVASEADFLSSAEMTHDPQDAVPLTVAGSSSDDADTEVSGHALHTLA